MEKTGETVIVSASLGFGHHRIAASIKEAMDEQGMSARIIDLLEEGRTLQGIGELYLAMLNNTPSIYGNAYFWSKKAGSSSGLFSLLCYKSLEKIRQRFQPAAFVFVHPLGAAAYRASCGVPGFAVTSDLAFHTAWFNRELWSYFVARETIKTALVKQGYPGEHVFCTGIPIAAAFGGCDRVDINTAGSMADLAKPFVLIMGGGLGMGPISETVELLEKLQFPLEGAILTGHNRQLQQALAERFRVSAKRWQVLPFVERVEQLMCRADFLISKGGAVTLSEAAACGLPVIIHCPLPGQEEDNTSMAVSEGWACRTGDPDSLCKAVKSLLASPGKCEEMSRLARARSMPLAAKQIVHIICEALKTWDRRKTS